MALDDSRGTQTLVRLDGDAVTVLDDDLTLSNGLAWSPGGSTLYSIDSVNCVVQTLPTSPHRTLAAIRVMTRASTSRTTFPGAAPSAIRIPISARRRATA